MTTKYIFFILQYLVIYYIYEKNESINHPKYVYGLFPMISAIIGGVLYTLLEAYPIILFVLSFHIVTDILHHIMHSEKLRDTLAYHTTIFILTIPGLFLIIVSTIPHFQANYMWLYYCMNIVGTALVGYYGVDYPVTDLGQKDLGLKMVYIYTGLTLYLFMMSFGIISINLVFNLNDKLILLVVNCLMYIFVVIFLHKFFKNSIIRNALFERRNNFHIVDEIDSILYRKEVALNRYLKKGDVRGEFSHISVESLENVKSNALIQLSLMDDAVSNAIQLKSYAYLDKHGIELVTYIANDIEWTNKNYFMLFSVFDELEDLCDHLQSVESGFIFEGDDHPAIEVMGYMRKRMLHFEFKITGSVIDMDKILIQVDLHKKRMLKGSRNMLSSEVAISRREVVISLDENIWTSTHI